MSKGGIMANLLFKLVWYWIKGSAIFVLILIVMLFDGKESPGTFSSSNFLNWLVSFGLAITPIGAAVGLFTYIF